MVAGDDAVNVVHEEDGFICIESDRSLYDGSQLQGPIEHENDLLRQLGVGPLVMSMLESMAGGRFNIGSKDTEIFIRLVSAVMRRLTGGPKTTFGNSANTMAHELAAARRIVTRVRTESVRETYDSFGESLGFTLKTQVFVDPLDMTFLKGMWWRTVAGPPIWAPLPSRIVKFGKSLVNPCTIFKQQLRAVPLVDRYAQGARLFLAAQAANYRSFLPVPLLSTMTEKYGMDDADALWEYAPWRPVGMRGRSVNVLLQRLSGLRGTSKSEFFTAFLEQIVVTDTGNVWMPQPDHELNMELVHARYCASRGITYASLMEFDKMLAESPEFTFIQHPLAEALMATDY
jgi:hypothetical protein